MDLSAQILEHIEAKEQLTLPEPSVFNLPEKVLQFGTGVLLRGLPDYFIDQANKKGCFNGRIVMVKSTATGGTSEYDRQDNLYTHCVRGYDRGEEVTRYIVNASISRVLNASGQWQEILACAAGEAMQIVISNTTEVGIVMDETEDLNNGQPPKSFPGKLTAFLYARYKAFNGVSAAGMVILPTELITNNGALLKSICLQLAQQHYNDKAFDHWLSEANDFCDTLVDRIVPGALPAHESGKVSEYLGFRDDLMIMSETYSLWAIQSSLPRTKDILSFAAVNDGVIITPDIEKFRNLKLRLLNGAHTFSCGLALISGFETVKEAMHNAFFERFIQDLMLREISTTLVSEAITEDEVIKFSKAVMDRFRNPFIEHKWESIAMNFSSKMAMRNVPTLLAWYHRSQQVPKAMSLGFAAYLYFLKSDINDHGRLYRNCYGRRIAIDDPLALRINQYWKAAPLETAVADILSDQELWGTDLTALRGFPQSVIDHIRKLQTQAKPAVKLA